jgi:prolyl-tRNA synthetase
VIPVKKDDPLIFEQAVKIYKEAGERGLDVLLDDREKSPGVKFKDADLVGVPVQVIVGRKSLDKNRVEIKKRDSGQKELIEKDKVVDYLVDFITKNK